MASLAAAAWLALANNIVPIQADLADVELLPAQDTYEEIAEGPESHKFVGTMSCSSTACHGSVLPHRGGFDHGGKTDVHPVAAPILRNEYLVWIEQDPHSRAAAALRNDRSRRILRGLGALIRHGDNTIETEKYAVTMRTCAACHDPAANTRWENSLATDPREMRDAVGISRGVTCESCHGAAADYLAPHYRRGWPKNDPVEKESAYGMTNTEHLLPRARMCAKCHVGAEGKDVNHDLIAAGHPALKFEFTSYLELLPKHWDEQSERMRTPEFETRAWVAGQIASLEAALDLLAYRTTDHGAAKHLAGPPVHPEFAEYDCFACHHDLQAPSWRIRQPTGDQAIGRLARGNWYYATAKVIVKDESEFVSQLYVLGDSMSGLSTPRADVHAQAREARRQLAKWVSAERLAEALLDGSDDGRWPKIKARLIENLSAAFAADGRDGLHHWDVAVQTYMLLAALDQAKRDRKGMPNPPRTASSQARLRELRALRKSLAFPIHYDSPRTFPARLEMDESDMPPIRDDIRSQFMRIEAMLHD